MPITSDQLKYFKSSDANSTGGSITTVEITGALHEVFPPVTGDQAQTGSAAEYRKIFIQNISGLTLYEARVFFSTYSPDVNNKVSIDMVTSTDLTGSTPPTSGWAAPQGTELNPPADFQIGSLGPGESIAVWIRRTVAAGAVAQDNLRFDIMIRGDTPE